jgi:Mg2+ and Co2+ transporter CorA
MDRVVDDYAPVIAGVENDIDEIEDEVFDGTADASRRIYELHWYFGYPFSLALMAAVCLGLYRMFKRRDWI